MNKNYLTNAIEEYLKKYRSGKLSSTDLEKGVAFLLDSDKSEKYITEEVRNYYNGLIEEIKAAEAAKLAKLEAKKQAKEEKALAKASKIKKYQGLKNHKNVGFALGAMAAVVTLTSWSCGSTKSEELEVSQVQNENSIDSSTTKVVIDPVEKEVVQEKILSSSLSFDPNDNKELVERMTNFVVDSLNSGIAIKDFMTEEEIETAKKADASSVITLEQLMDYYFVLNVEDIEPEDYARLGYKAKTTDTILENYKNVANEYSMDLLTVNYDTLIDYNEIVAHKDSAKAINDFNSLVAKLNTSSNKQEVIKETREYVNTNYITNEANIYSMSANEQVYRSMFSFDILSNGIGITKDVGIILMEDGTYTCGKTTEKEIKNKSERAQEETNIRNIIEEKIEESRKYYSQDLTNVSEYELKTGVALENEIKEKVLEKNATYVSNPVYKVEEVVSNNKSTTKSSNNTNNNQTTVTQADPSNVIGDNGKPIDNSEFEKYNIDSTDPNAKTNYEQSVRIATEQEFAASSEHVIKSNDGEAVVAGNDVNVEDYNRGYADGYFDGNNKKSANASGSSSYIAGYNLGYVAGAKDREEIDKQYQNKTETHYEPVYNAPEETISETVTEQGYIGEVPNYGNKDVTVDYNYGNNSTSNNESSNDVVIKEEFVPVENGKEEIIDESVTEENYTSNEPSVTSETVEVKLEENNAPRTVEVKQLKKESTLEDDVNSIQLRYLNALKSLIKESSKIVEDTEEVLNRVR